MSPAKDPGQITVTISVAQDHARRVAAALGRDPSADAVAALSAELEAFARAALDEYLLTISGDRIPSGVRDLRELRLALMAGALPDGLPSDEQVARLFHLTTAQARTLVAGARARYPDKIEGQLRERAKDALRTADAVAGGPNTVRIRAADSLAAYMRDIVSASTAPPLIRRMDASQRYDVSRSAVTVLCTRLEMKISEVKALKTP